MSVAILVNVHSRHGSEALGARIRSIFPEARVAVTRSLEDARVWIRDELQARRPDESQVVVTVIDSRGETGRDLLQAFVANQSLPGGAAPPAGALGLALAQRLIQLMGGQLGVSQHTPAAKPAGWQFELVLPTDNLNVP